MAHKEGLNGHVSFSELSDALVSDFSLSPYDIAQNKIAFNSQSAPYDKIIGSFDVTKPHVTEQDGIRYRFRLERRKSVNSARFQPDSTPEERRRALEAIMVVGRADRIIDEDSHMDEANPGAERLIYYSIYKDGMLDYNGEPVSPDARQLIINMIESIPESSK